MDMPGFSTPETIYTALSAAGFAVTTDTRKITPGSVFFALRGPNFNANSFAAQALAQGCAYAVVDDPSLEPDNRLLLVSDVLQALQAVATLHRRKHSIPVLAITGSNAKTTTKELINAVLSQKYSTLATIGNLNNHIGVPLTLLRLRAEHTFAIIEMGANHQGEIDALCRIAEPDHGLITNIGKAHLEGFGGIEGVKKGKSEMYRYLAARSGKVFVNADDELLMALSAANHRVTYSIQSGSFITGRDLSDGGDVKLKYGAGTTVDWDAQPVISTKLSGSYNFVNCLAAACVAQYFGVAPGQVKSALEAYEPTMNRSQLAVTARNKLILDAYNANPSSMTAALNNLASMKAPKKMAILGDMFELGADSANEHQRVAELAKGLKIDRVLLVGNAFAATGLKGVERFADTDACRAYLQRQPPQDFLILLKGSRGMKMESLSDLL
jgi:UDP-N-acetylmuramoyl-tripeptide--D-alanyl-D-alanine ligase